MITLKKAMDEKKFDTRLIELHLQTGKISQQEYAEYLKSLKDCQDNAAVLQLSDSDNAEKSPLN